MNGFTIASSIEGRSRRFFVFADHASNCMPNEFGRLGLPDDILETHIAWDPGAGALTRRLAEKLDAPGLLCGFSRLLIDPNRSRDRADLVLEASDMIPVLLDYEILIAGHRYHIGALRREDKQNTRRIIELL